MNVTKACTIGVLAVFLLLSAGMVGSVAADPGINFIIQYEGDCWEDKETYGPNLIEAPETYYFNLTWDMEKNGLEGSATNSKGEKVQYASKALKEQYTKENVTFSYKEIYMGKTGKEWIEISIKELKEPLYVFEVPVETGKDTPLQSGFILKAEPKEDPEPVSSSNTTVTLDMADLTYTFSVPPTIQLSPTLKGVVSGETWMNLTGGANATADVIVRLNVASSDDGEGEDHTTFSVFDEKGEEHANYTMKSSFTYGEVSSEKTLAGNQSTDGAPFEMNNILMALNGSSTEIGKKSEGFLNFTTTVLPTKPGKYTGLLTFEAGIEERVQPKLE